MGACNKASPTTATTFTKTPGNAILYVPRDSSALDITRSIDSEHGDPFNRSTATVVTLSLSLTAAVATLSLSLLILPSLSACLSLC
ncbi:unnamed protein product [Peronospora belbahrii]|uniref:Uncharacterized protein n=1 Tax=Peronospora belbahrii TaxID=622444 RepID=A0ABN8CRT7_9STRA|nr:unnamed protein product [Peronospora belbahrii]